MPRRRTSWLAVYLGALALLGLASLLARPIVAVDADLWFHLSHGRQLAADQVIPSTSYFSFISPPKAGVNYYWLFEAGVYGVYAAGGYFGLIVFRASIYGLFLLFVGRFLFHGERGTPRRLWLAFLFGLYLTQALSKYLLVRPHGLSYLSIAIFIYVLETAPKKVWLLVPLAVLWTNFHGIEYPVMILITGSYSVELVWKSGVLRQSSPADTRRLAALCLAMAAVFLTPHGLDLIRLPFQSTGFVSHVINEMSLLSPEEYLVYQLSSEGFTTVTLSNLLIAIGLIAAVSRLIRRRLRPSHLLMAGGGLFLLTQGVRFTHECALLLLPLAKNFDLVPRTARWRPRTALVVAAALALATPFPYLAARLPTSVGAYPLSLADLPHGIASFLNGVDAGGKVMNNPNHGAYLLWALYPRYRIYMDLEVAFLFDEADMFELASAFYDRESLRRFLLRYDPEFIAAPIAAAGFPALVARHPEYQLVFFDDTGALYVDRERYPRIAAAHGLHFVDPFTLAGTRFSSLDPATASGYLRELRRIIEIDPGITSVNQAAAILYNLERRYGEALERAEAVIRKEPRVARGYAIKADALVGLGEVDAAVAHFRRALAISQDAAERQAIHRALARCLSGAERFGEAYRELAKAVGEFNIEASYVDLYNLGALAAAAGRPEEALRMFRFARLKVPPEEEAWRRKIEENLTALEPSPAARHE